MGAPRGERERLRGEYERLDGERPGGGGGRGGYNLASWEETHGWRLMSCALGRLSTSTLTIRATRSFAPEREWPSGGGGGGQLTGADALPLGQVEVEPGLGNQPEETALVTGPEGRVANQHDMEEDAERPDIHLDPVA